MRNKRINLSILIMAAGFLILILMACTSSAGEPTPSPAAAASTSTEKPISSPVPTLPEPASDSNILYEDNFTDPSTKWPEQQYDNYYIGYHQSTYYHIQLSSPQLKTSVYIPGKPTYGDVTINLKVLTEVATAGDFRYGLTFRRTGDLYYAFVISPITKKWYVFKSSSDSFTPLAEGTESSIHDIGGADELRVDLVGGTFSLYVNNEKVGETSDPEYTNGEVGMFVQTLDSPATHIHFDDLTILKPNGGLPLAGWLYRDDFTNPASGWPNAKDDNYFTSYHEPDYLQVQLLIPRYKRTVNVPGKLIFEDVTIDLKVLTEIEWQPGDFRYGLTFRQTGDLYYAFIISPVTKKWYVLKSSSDALKTLQEGTADNIEGRRVTNILRVDAQGNTFTFHINNLLVGEISDTEYPSGEVGLFAQTIDSIGTHIHFDDLTIWDFQQPSFVTSPLLGKENCTNGLDDDGDTFIDFTDSDCSNIFISTDYHNGANGPVNDTNCAMCHTLPWPPAPTTNQPNQPNQPDPKTKPPGHPNSCGPCHSPPSSNEFTKTPKPSSNNPTGTPSTTVVDPHNGANGPNCSACHTNGTPTPKPPTPKPPTPEPPTPTLPSYP